jgi:Tol biopolymer transport system component
MACAVVVLVRSEMAEATFPGKNGRIAYTDWDGGNDYEIYTINPDRSGKRQLTHNNTDDFDPSYSPDAKKIVYAGQDGPKGDLEIYTINASGEDKFQLTNSDVDEEWPTYSPDGEKIAYMGPDGGIYSIKVGGGGKSRVTNNYAYPQKLSWGTRP